MFDHPWSGREAAVDGLFIFRIEDSNTTLKLKPFGVSRFQRSKLNNFAFDDSTVEM